MKARNHQELIKEIEDHFSKNVTQDAKFTILTIRNLIQSNERVEKSVDELHKTINDSNKQNERLQKGIYFLTIVTVILALVQAITAVVQFLSR